MKKNLYAIRDNLTFTYEQPFVFETDLTCLRAVSGQISQEKISFEKKEINFDPALQHATRSLYHVGFFDEQTGIIEPFNSENSDTVRLICVLSDAPNLYQKLLTEF